MTTVLDTRPPAAATTSAAPAHTARRVTLPGVLHSEWIKLRSVRSTTWSYIAAAAALLFFGSLAAAFTGGLLASPEDGGGPGGTDPTGIVLSGVPLVALIIGVLGVMVMTSEYATGTIRSTMTFVPRRLQVLGAKAVVLTAVTLPVMLVATVGTFLVGQALLGAGDAGTATAALGDDGVLRAVLGTAVYLTGITLIGLALGSLLRSTPAALSVLVALFFLIPGLGSFLLPASVRDDVLPYLPSNAGSAFTSVSPTPDLLSAGTGAVVFAAWILVPLVIAALRLVRRPV
jgi:ABC-type transport system involved in multi-copper enzyme maturation permease subunit